MTKSMVLKFCLALLASLLTAAPALAVELKCAPTTSRIVLDQGVSYLLRVSHIKHNTITVRAKSDNRLCGDEIIINLNSPGDDSSNHYFALNDLLCPGKTLLTVLGQSTHSLDYGIMRRTNLGDVTVTYSWCHGVTVNHTYTIIKP